jgi:tetratricopeptide (TPR) repeat protein
MSTRGLALSTALVAALSLGAAEARASTVDPRLAQAEALAKKREIDAAADLYRGLVKDGVDGESVQYNLGTLALEQGRIGEAVLHLRSAHRLAPGDDDVAHNLEVALEARTDRLAGERAPDPVRVVGQRLSPRLARALFAVPLSLAGVLLALLGLVASVRVRRIARVALMISLTLTAVGAALYGARLSVEHTREAVILADQTAALKDPDDAAAVSFTAHAGLFGDVMEESGGFVRIRFENGLEAWIKLDTLGFV